MSGWVMLGLLAVAAAGALWLLGLRGAMLQLGIAALFFGCAGYSLQGRPDLSGSPRAAGKREPPMPLANLRHDFFGQFTGVEHWLVMSESFARRGDTEQAVGILRAAIREHPGDSQLWLGMGNALVDHAGGLTPAGEYAYQRAAELAPGHPAPGFFYGLALARSGAPDDAITVWKELLASAPANAPWRPIVEDAVAAMQPRPASKP